MDRLSLVAVVFVLAAALLAPAAEAADLPHHLALFAGLGVESKQGREDENGFALGLEYEFRFHKRWGIGGVVEGLGQDTIRNVLVVVPVSFHPVGGLRLIAGPGMEFTPKKDKWALRLGVGYIFHVSERWSLSPEIFLDLIETGENTWIAGLALGYGFQVLISASGRKSLAGVVLAVCFMAPSVADAQIGSPPRPVAGFKNAAAFGLSYGVNNTRDADFWGWSVEGSRQLGGRWFGAVSIMWDRQTENAAAAPDPEIDTFTGAVTISYGLTKRLAITTGLGKGFADTDNPSESMRFTNGDLATGIVLGLSTPGLRHFERDSVAYEYNITQNETTLSFDVAFGWSF